MVEMDSSVTYKDASSKSYPNSSNKTVSNNEHKSRIVTIEWHMLDKRKYFPLSATSNFCVRCVLHPLSVIKTKIQVQRQNKVYNGTFDAFFKIFRAEGVGGLYKGFWISTLQLFSGVAYIGCYESVREVMLQQGITDSRLRALCGGAAASLVSQTIMVPFDILSQHMMVIGQKHGGTELNPFNINYKHVSNRVVATRLVSAIYTQSGLRGFYRGYTASLLTYVPNSACWWILYHVYQDLLSPLLPAAFPTLATQCLSASMGGVTTALISNPLDILRARLQVEATGPSSICATMQQLWLEERYRVFTIGLSARLIQTVVYSSVIICGYETVKRLSVNEEYKHLVRW